MMKPHIRYTLIGLIAAGMVGCASGGSSTENELGSDEIPELDAGTDAAPAPSAETPTAEAPPAEGQPTAAAADAPPAADQALADPSTTPPADAPPADPTAAAAPTAPADTAAAAPATGTAPQAQAPTTFSGEFMTYSVSGGDTLMKIAFETYGDLYQWKRIYEDNKDKLANPNTLAPGLTLKLAKPSEAVQIAKNGDKYLIKNGDTLGKISDDIYGTARKWRKLWENNKQLIKDPNKIFAGFFLYYTMTPQERDEADRLKQSRGAPPLASGGPAAGSADGTRNPASMGAPVEETPAMNAVNQPPQAQPGDNPPKNTVSMLPQPSPPQQQQQHQGQQGQGQQGQQNVAPQAMTGMAPGANPPNAAMQTQQATPPQAQPGAPHVGG